MTAEKVQEEQKVEDLVDPDSSDKTDTESSEELDLDDDPAEEESKQDAQSEFTNHHEVEANIQKEEGA